MSERRSVARQRSYLGGVVAFQHRSSTAECLIRDISPRGAKLVFDAPLFLPAEFDLAVTRRNESHRARTAWRTGNVVGVVFASAGERELAPAPVSLDMARRLRDCESDKARLRRRVDQLTSGS